MSKPKDSYGFINPYNFVPFGDYITDDMRKDKNEVYLGDVQKELLSGWLDMEIHIKTPLIIPDGAHPKYYDLQKGKIVNCRNEIADPKNRHLEYDFFKLYNSERGQEEYAIPGSEIRGMIRSTYEAVTNSCVPNLLDDKKPNSQRVPIYGALKKRGLLKYDGRKWILYDTRKILEEVVVVPVYKNEQEYYVESMKRVRDCEQNKENNIDRYEIMKYLDNIEEYLSGREYKSKQIHCVEKINFKKQIEGYLFVKVDEIEDKGINIDVINQPTGTFVENKGWLQYNVPVNTNMIYHVAYLMENSKNEIKVWPEGKAEDNEEAYQKLKSALDRDTAYGNNMMNHPNKECNKNLKEALKRACEDSSQLVPVYYFDVKEEEEERKSVYLSGSAIGRIGQRRKWQDIMEGHTPCNGENLCPACLLFGNKSTEGLKGHVRFSDAFMEHYTKIDTSIHTLDVLSSPKPTAFEFYLNKPVDEATYWNFDFYGVTKEEDGQSKGTEYEQLQKGMLQKQALPRGRKMYWHHKISKDARNQTNLNNTMEAVDHGVFKSKIFFNQITKKQLNDLIWSINLGENDVKGKELHKLGHAKPLGYGSVKLVVTGGKIRKFDMKEESFSYQMEEVKDAGINIEHPIPSFKVDSKAVSSLLRMCDATTISAGQTVDYPRKKPRGKIYEWFANNRKNAQSLQILPQPMDHLIMEYNDSHEDNSKNTGIKNEKEEIVLILNKTMKDNKKAGQQIGYTATWGEIIFGLPMDVKRGDRVEVSLSKRTEEKVYYNYVDKF